MVFASIRVHGFRLVLTLTATAATAALAVACADDSEPTGEPPASSVDGGSEDGSPGPAPGNDGGADPDGGGPRADRFVTKVVSFTPGQCAGFGASEMPGIVLGPPAGAGDQKGSLDVVSLGVGGELVVSFEPNGIVDGPGADFIVFENAFFAAGNPNTPSADPGEVSVSEDGVTWMTYECTPGAAAPYGKCAGWHPVYAAPGNGVSPFDPRTAGGEAYDLSELGLPEARYVRIRDKSSASCEGQPKPQNLGFDLDAIGVINAQTP